jgi:hypothetical protein
MEGATAGQQTSGSDDAEDEDDEPLIGTDQSDTAPDEAGDETDDFGFDPTIQQAMEQSDERSHRKRDPEY